MNEQRNNQAANGGAIHISEDVIVELARKTIQGIPNIKIAAKLKSDGVRVSVDHSEGSMAIDAYVLVKYGQRIPDLAWDVQEKIKDNLERYTGYDVKAVNVNVQGVYSNSGDEFQLDLALDDEATFSEEAD